MNDDERVALEAERDQLVAARDDAVVDVENASSDLTEVYDRGDDATADERLVVADAFRVVYATWNDANSAVLGVEQKLAGIVPGPDQGLMQPAPEGN